jgi:alkylation response protein AidB-like acyl-CoA dehydrogenase
VRAHSASEDIRAETPVFAGWCCERAGDTRPEPGSSARAAQNAANGLPSLADSSIAKCFANEMVREVTALGMQVMGGYGYSTEYRMEQRLRDSYGWGIAGGTIDVQKTNIAAALIGRRFNQRR